MSRSHSETYHEIQSPPPSGLRDDEHIAGDDEDPEWQGGLEGTGDLEDDQNQPVEEDDDEVDEVSSSSEEERAPTAVSSVSSRTKNRRSSSTRHSSDSTKYDRGQHALVRDLQLNLGKQTHRLMQLELDKEYLERTVSSQRRKLSAKDVEIGELNVNLQEHKEAVETYEDELEDLTQENAGLRNDIRDQAATIAGLNEDIENQMKENGELRKLFEEAKRWKNEVDELKRAMDKKDRMLIEERVSKASKSAEVVQTVAELLKVKEENRSLAGKVESLGREVERSRTAPKATETDGMKGKGKGKALVIDTTSLSRLTKTDATCSSSVIVLDVGETNKGESTSLPPPTPVFSRPSTSVSGLKDNYTRRLQSMQLSSLDFTRLLNQRTISRNTLEHELLQVADLLTSPSQVQDPAALEMVTRLIKALALVYFMVEEDDALIRRAETLILDINASTEGHEHVDVFDDSDDEESGDEDDGNVGVAELASKNEGEVSLPLAGPSNEVGNFVLEKKPGSPSTRKAVVPRSDSPSPSPASRFRSKFDTRNRIPLPLPIPLPTTPFSFKFTSLAGMRDGGFGQDI
ncbi:hypothetical protein AAF712_015702 [Marasmius tenuissimus]|uniref:Uncharacterized protein n=1 Tax=Marasmius tenuissimus TaxID=585030 RepID=A0ABR2Z7J7_9AGAR